MKRDVTAVSAIIALVVFMAGFGLYLIDDPTITGADTLQTANASFTVSSLIDIQWKNFTDSDSFAVNVVGLQGFDTCDFMTADSSAGNFTDRYTDNLTPASSGCSTNYTTLSEDNATQGAFGIKSVNSNIPISLSITAGAACPLGGSCVRKVVAHEQTSGDCTKNATTHCIKTAASIGGSVEYKTLSGTSTVDLCGNLTTGGGLEIDFRYSFTNYLLAPGNYTDTFTVNATTSTDCSTI